MQRNESLTPKQHALIAALQAHPSIVEAAKACNISEATAHRWLAQPAFKEAYREQQKSVYQSNMGLLRIAMKKAIATLIKNLDAKSPFVQVMAAKTIMELNTEQYKIEHIESTLSEIQERLQIGDGRRGNIRSIS